MKLVIKAVKIWFKNNLTIFYFQLYFPKKILSKSLIKIEKHLLCSSFDFRVNTFGCVFSHCKCVGELYINTQLFYTQHVLFMLVLVKSHKNILEIINKNTKN